MAQASQYGVGFGYGAQDGLYYGPNGRIGKYHRGNDFYTPIGTDVVVNGILIARTGRSGMVSGPHVHVQAMQGASDINPTGREWNVPGARVVQTGTTNVEGNFIKLQGSDGVVMIYMHLSQILVNTGQVIGQPANQGGSEVANRDQANNLYKAILFREGDAGGLANYTGKDANFIASDMLNSQERRNLEGHINTTRDSVNNLQSAINNHNGVVADLTNKLNDATNATNTKQVELNQLNEQLAITKLEIASLNEKLSQPAVIVTPVQTKPPTTPRLSKPNPLFALIVKLITFRTTKKK